MNEYDHDVNLVALVQYWVINCCEKCIIRRSLKLKIFPFVYDYVSVRGLCVQDPVIPGLVIKDSTVCQKIYKYAVSLSTLLFMVTITARVV